MWCAIGPLKLCLLRALAAVVAHACAPMRAACARARRSNPPCAFAPPPLQKGGGAPSHTRSKPTQQHSLPPLLLAEARRARHSVERLSALPLGNAACSCCVYICPQLGDTFWVPAAAPPFSIGRNFPGTILATVFFPRVQRAIALRLLLFHPTFLQAPPWHQLAGCLVLIIQHLFGAPLGRLTCRRPSGPTCSSPRGA